MPQTVLVTGGAGFIGSHTCVELLQSGHEVVVLDDHSNSSPQALERVAKIAGRPIAAVHTADVRDRRALDAVFTEHAIDAVIHFAAKKAVGESVQIPLTYYDINVGGTTALASAMHEHGVHRLVFSSSCSIYGNATVVPLTEESPAAPTNPYATTKWTCEQILGDLCRHVPELRVLALRYFNPAGAHPSGLLGEDPSGVPNNIMPFLAQIAVGRREELSVFGDDYPTPDGTGVRDYIHVVDVAEGHVAALDHFDDRPGLQVFNLGTGRGSSVLELVHTFQQACGTPIPYRVAPRRPGDVAELVADPAKVEAAWGWRARRDLAAMCRDAWNFQQNNPYGYAP
ncbi:UDP-galactose 4-epimerase [Streptomyces sp. DI166]|uniref:UDP-glucose 4-epimerase GalE n=1 Tax=unclassified Streptomyces TaxID=2593676 RepID=UPI0007F44836|nr:MULTISPECIES: UDP-glucose 4-epimerase GalE [unclassified Streptomyces]SBT89086.1 UDP-galactose 4-epimerase [Streptomyces sp. DI166]